MVEHDDGAPVTTVRAISTAQHAERVARRRCCRQRSRPIAATTRRTISSAAASCRRPRRVSATWRQQPGRVVGVGRDQQVLVAPRAAGNSWIAWNVRPRPRRARRARASSVTSSPNSGRARGGRYKSGDGVEQRGLAGAVGADEADDLALVQLSARLVDGDQSVELDADVARLEQRHAQRHDAGRRPRRRRAGQVDAVAGAARPTAGRRAPASMDVRRAAGRPQRRRRRAPAGARRPRRSGRSASAAARPRCGRSRSRHRRDSARGRRATPAADYTACARPPG